MPTWLCVYGCEFTGSIAAHYFEEHPLSGWAEQYAHRQMPPDDTYRRNARPALERVEP